MVTIMKRSEQRSKLPEIIRLVKAGRSFREIAQIVHLDRRTAQKMYEGWEYEEEQRKKMSPEERIARLEEFVEWFRINFLVSGIDIKQFYCIKCENNTLEYHEKSGDPEDSDYMTWQGIKCTNCGWELRII